MALVAIILSILSLIACAFIYMQHRTILHKYGHLIQGSKGENITDIVGNLLSEGDQQKKIVAQLSTHVQTLLEDAKYHTQKVGLLRFNPFADTGGDQSFVLAILDGRDSGIVLTSLHTRGVTRWYAKNVHEGKGVDHELSAEERKSIAHAVSIRQKIISKKMVE